MTRRALSYGHHALAASALLCLIARPTIAQQASAPRRDTLYLDALQHAAESSDARATQLGVLARQSALRVQNIKSEVKPSIGAAASAQYVSDVANVGLSLPNGFKIPTPFNEQYDSYLTAREPLFDATRVQRANVESAQLAESEARVHAALYQQRQQVNDAFFAITLADAQMRAIENAVADLTARRANADTRVNAGTSLPSETLLIDAELAKRNQSLRELRTQRDAARQVLASLVGQAISETAVLATRQSTELPAPMPESFRARPEFTQFDRARLSIDARRRATASQDLPRLSLVGRAGYGRPGLNALGRSFDTYYTAGVQLEWTAFNWGRSRRELEAQQLQREMVAADETSFSESLRRAATTQLAQIRALEQSLADDDTIVALREHVLRETRLRFDEGDVTSADYIARLTESTSAQLDRDTRRVRLSEAKARYLTTIGHEVR